VATCCLVWISSQPGLARRAAVGGLACTLILLPVYLHVANNKQYRDALTADLNRLGGHVLSGHVQCLEMPLDCDATLYRMQLVQSTGLLYDYLIFSSGQGSVIRAIRERFREKFQKNVPRVIVIGRDLYPVGLASKSWIGGRVSSRNWQPVMFFTTIELFRGPR
jgi:hypothetical protein